MKIAQRDATGMAFKGTLLKGAAVSATMLVAAACGSGGASPAATGTTSPPVATASPAPTLIVCQDVNALRGTLDSLTPVKGSGLPTSAQMKAAASAIESSLAGLANRTEWQSQISSLKAAAANLRSAAEALAASPGARSAAPAARTALAQVNDAIRRLVTAVGSRCPAPTSTASSS
jgi:hypothetical protein